VDGRAACRKTERPPGTATSLPESRDPSPRRHPDPPRAGRDLDPHRRQPLPAILYLLIWFASQLLESSASGLGAPEVGGVAVWAHIGGFVCGALLHRLFLDRGPPDR